MSYFVRMTDKALSGWGAAEGRRNVLVIECDTWDQAEAIFNAATRRPEMQRVKIVQRMPKDRPGVLYSRRHFSHMTGDWLFYFRPLVFLSRNQNRDWQIIHGGAPLQSEGSLRGALACADHYGLDVAGPYWDGAVGGWRPWRTLPAAAEEVA
jgi:hypothetical protein